MDLLETFFSSSLVTQIVTQSNKFTELRHGVQQINSICKTQLVRQLGRQATSFLLRRKNPRIDTIRGLCLVKRLGKAIFYTTTLSLANRFYLPNVVSKAVSKTTHYQLRRKVLRIDIIRETLLVERLAKFHRNLALVTYVITQSNKFTGLRH